ncbi:MAG: gluconokinase, GntK/IdnK-type, partial [Anaerolineae bacterium]
MIIVLIGVSGVGKTTVGQQLAADLGWPFHDGDDFHPQTNVDKMRRGVPLTDADRIPWLDRLRSLIEHYLHSSQSAVLACSALKAAYRDRLRQGD